MKKIIILWASVRPKMLYQTYLTWINNANNPNNIMFKIAVLNDEQKQEIDGYKFPNFEVQVVNKQQGYNYAITKLTTELETDDDDILIFLSDDFNCQKGWDGFIYSKFENWDGAVFLNDGYQNPLVKEGVMMAITLGCLTFGCLKKLNKIMFHPDYNHYFSDNEAFRNIKDLNLLKDERDTDQYIFEHKVVNMGKRKQDEHDKRYNENFAIDRLTFYRRMILPDTERMSIKEGLFD